jgi:hypothetical protein
LKRFLLALGYVQGLGIALERLQEIGVLVRVPAYTFPRERPVVPGRHATDFEAAILLVVLVPDRASHQRRDRYLEAKTESDWTSALIPLLNIASLWVVRKTATSVVAAAVFPSDVTRPGMSTPRVKTSETSSTSAATTFTVCMAVRVYPPANKTAVTLYSPGARPLISNSPFSTGCIFLNCRLDSISWLSRGMATTTVVPSVCPGIEFKTWP